MLTHSRPLLSLICTSCIGLAAMGCGEEYVPVENNPTTNNAAMDMDLGDGGVVFDLGPVNNIAPDMLDPNENNETTPTADMGPVDMTPEDMGD